MQVAFVTISEEANHLVFPDPETEVITGVSWGRFEHLFTPAFWALRSRIHQRDPRFHQLRLGTTLVEEVCRCLLSGYGTAAEVGLAAYLHLLEHGVFEKPTSTLRIVELLSQPLQVGERTVLYRFRQQRAAYIARILELLPPQSESVPKNPLALRDLLVRLPGIGPKTASWVVRNWCQSNEVAVIDTHILRAGKLMGLFPSCSDPSRDYNRLERDFLALAHGISVPASLLDTVMWHYMRRIGHLA